MGELSCAYFYPFFRHKRLPMKKIPHWSLLRAFRLSKIESTIEHLLSRAHQKSTRSYHNGVPRHHPIENSLAAFPLWVAFVQSTLQCVFLRSHQYQNFVHLLQVFPICNYIPGITRYDPSPMSSLHSLPGQLCHHTLNNGS